MTDLELARLAVEAACKAGAGGADAILSAHDDVSVHVRDAEVERVEQARSRGVGVRALVGKRTGISYTNNPTAESVRQAAVRAVELARVAAEDPHAGLPDPAEVGALVTDLDCVDPAVEGLGSDALREMALAVEGGSLGVAGVTQSGGCRAGRRVGGVAFATSAGFSGEKHGTSVVAVASAFARGTGGERQRDNWMSHAVHLADLDDPGSVGRIAGERAVARCGWRRPPSGAFPVVLAPEVGRDFAGVLSQALLATAVYRNSTFLGDRLGEQIASAGVTLVDDATLPRRAASRAFDGEGVRSRRTVLVDRGMLASWLSDTYSARRTGGTTTANASRGLSSAPAVGCSNLVLEPGTVPREELLAMAGRGLLVTELFGMGVNLATGAWSRGGSGFWLEDGRVDHPVQEFTIAGDLTQLLQGVRAVGSDLEWMSSRAAPSLLIDGFTVSAED